jgi:hypothetical protein
VLVYPVGGLIRVKCWYSQWRTRCGISVLVHPLEDLIRIVLVYPLEDLMRIVLVYPLEDLIRIIPSEGRKMFSLF